jgi:hypothetical protein
VAWGGIHPIGTVSDIRLNKALESELEQMFIERLRRAVRDRQGIFNKIAVAGKPGYAIKLGNGEWRLEPQCWLQEKKMFERPSFARQFRFVAGNSRPGGAETARNLPRRVAIPRPDCCR